MNNTENLDDKTRTESIETLLKCGKKPRKAKVAAYPEEKKALGVAMCKSGYSQRQVSVALDVGATTVCDWVNKRPLNDQQKDLCGNVIDELASKFAYTTNMCLDSVTPAHLLKANIQQILFGAGISNRNMMELLEKRNDTSPKRAHRQVIDVRARHKDLSIKRISVDAEIQALRA